MGLLLNGLMYVFKEIADRADKEINDDEAVKAELMALHASLEAGSITEEAFEAKELELVERLQEIEERKAPSRPAPRKVRAARRRASTRKQVTVPFVDAETAPVDAAAAPAQAPSPSAEAASPPVSEAPSPAEVVTNRTSDTPPSMQKGRELVHS